MRISDWSSDVCSSDLGRPRTAGRTRQARQVNVDVAERGERRAADRINLLRGALATLEIDDHAGRRRLVAAPVGAGEAVARAVVGGNRPAAVGFAISQYLAFHRSALPQTEPPHAARTALRRGY